MKLNFKDYSNLEKIFLGVFGLILLVFISFVGLKSTGYEGDVNKTDWKKVELVDVSSGEKFTISELDKPLLVETFAVWCPTCTRQQQEIKKLHKRTNITTVSLNVDPNENKAKVRKHIKRHGFNWRYAVAPPTLTKSLVDNFGQVIVNPPSSPMVLVCENGSRKLATGVKPASMLKKEVKKGC